MVGHHWSEFQNFLWSVCTDRHGSGGDFHVAGDGNFMPRHNRSAGDCPPIDFKLEFFVPKEFVDAVGKALDIASGNPRQFESEVPISVLKHCESSHVAADGSREKTSGEAFDDRGLMALVCRHDIPLYLCNIDTPGEQQKYFISLVIWFMLHLPDQATVATFYDVNCVTWRMLAAVSPPRSSFES